MRYSDFRRNVADMYRVATVYNLRRAVTILNRRHAATLIAT
jgi:hypothetical protein